MKLPGERRVPGPDEWANWRRGLRRSGRHRRSRWRRRCRLFRRGVGAVAATGKTISTSQAAQPNLRHDDGVWPWFDAVSQDVDDLTAGPIRSRIPPTCSDAGLWARFARRRFRCWPSAAPALAASTPQPFDPVFGRKEPADGICGQTVAAAAAGDFRQLRVKATPDVRAGGSPPAERVRRDFDDTVSRDYGFCLPAADHEGGGRRLFRP